MDSGTIQSAKEFKPTPAGLQRKWTIEINAALDARKKWVQQADKANKRYLGEAGNDDQKTRVNLFHSNINVVLAIMYGQVPKVDVSRRFNDANDDESRVASEALERHLNTDIEDNADDFQREIKDSLTDWKITGLGAARLRYEADIEGDEGAETKGDEDIYTEYVHWRDFIWSPCRRWKEVRWVAFRAEMTKDQAAKRFPNCKGLPMQSRKMTDNEVGEDLKDAWSRIAVWEIWDKDTESVYWYCDGYNKILDQKKDPYQLDGFFPCPRPLVANVTTSKLMPKPDLEIDRHIYDEIDELADRLRSLVKRCRVTGAYDKSFPELGRILEEAMEGQLVGVNGWAALSEKGGVNGAIQIIDITPLIKAIEVLTTKLVEKIQLLYQVTGLSDIVRGEATQRATATEQRLKAGFASTRLQTDQDEVARFATDLQRLRAEIISKHFDVKTIIERSNLERVEVGPDGQPDWALIMKAVELIKSDVWQYRIEVKSDSIALRDYAALKQERVESIGALAGLFQQAIPMVQMFPQASPFILEISKWMIAATKGSQQLEGAFDRFAAQAEAASQQPKPPPPPDPKLQAEQVKAQAEMQKAQVEIQKAQVGFEQSKQEAQLRLAQIQMETEKAQVGLDQSRQEAQLKMAQTQMEMEKMKLEHQLDTTHMGAEHEFNMQKLAAEVQAEAQRSSISQQMKEEQSGAEQKKPEGDHMSGVGEGLKEIAKAMGQAKAPRTVKFNRDQTGQIHSAEEQ